MVLLGPLDRRGHELLWAQQLRNCNWSVAIWTTTSWANSPAKSAAVGAVLLAKIAGVTARARIYGVGLGHDRLGRRGMAPPPCRLATSRRAVTPPSRGYKGGAADRAGHRQAVSSRTGLFPWLTGHLVLGPRASGRRRRRGSNAGCTTSSHAAGQVWPARGRRTTDRAVGGRRAAQKAVGPCRYRPVRRYGPSAPRPSRCRGRRRAGPNLPQGEQSSPAQAAVAVL